MASEWFYQADGQHFGPIMSGELRRLAATGIVTPDTLVRKETDGRWVCAEKVQGLFERSGSPPPTAVRHFEDKPTNRAAASSVEQGPRDPVSSPPLSPKVQPVPSGSRRWKYAKRIHVAGWVVYFVLGTGYDTLRYYQRSKALYPAAIVRYSIQNLVMGAIWPLGILSRIDRALYERRNPSTDGWSEASTQQEELKQVFSRQEDYYSNKVRTGSDQSGAVGRRDGQSEKGIESHGVVGEIERLLIEAQNLSTKVENDCRRELETIGWNSTILNPTRLWNDKNLTRSRDILSKAKDVTQRYRAKQSSLLESLRLEIGRLNIDSYLKQEMLQDFDKGVKTAQPMMDRRWDLEEKCVDEFGNILNFLNAKSGSWRAVNGTMSFQSEQDTQKYNALLSSIRRSATEVVQIQKEAAEACRANFARLREGL